MSGWLMAPSTKRLATIAQAFVGAEAAASLVEYALLGVLIATVVAIAGLTLGNAISTERDTSALCVAPATTGKDGGVPCQQSGGRASKAATTPTPPRARGRLLQGLAVLGSGLGGEGGTARPVVYALLLVVGVTVGSIVGRNRGRKVATETGSGEPRLAQPGVGGDDAA